MAYFVIFFLSSQNLLTKILIHLIINYKDSDDNERIIAHGNRCRSTAAPLNLKMCARRKQ